jgi:hypothetical protein
MSRGQRVFTINYIIFQLACELIGPDVNLLLFTSCSRTIIYNLFQMKRTRCTLLLSIFISTPLRVSGNYVSVIRRTYCIYAALVFFNLYGWLSGLQTEQPPIQNQKYQCRIDRESSPDIWNIVARNM